jgi:hypothetical protein
VYCKHHVDRGRRDVERRVDRVRSEQVLKETKPTKSEEAKMKLAEIETNQMSHPRIVSETEWLVAREGIDSAARSSERASPQTALDQDR